jgi:hypothetical protein
MSRRQRIQGGPADRRRPLSKTGDATIKAKVSIPADCMNPVIVVRERYEGKVKGWLAATAN